MGLGAEWLDASSPLAQVVQEQSDENLRVYETSPTRVDEDAGQEMNLAHGGYGKRQILELVQNGADALLSAKNGRIHVVLTEHHLYCANEGEPIDADGIRALLHAHISQKRADEIGRFGLGFKSVLGVTDSPEFFSRAVSFGFNGAWARHQISEVAPDRERYPSLRVARLLEPERAAEDDAVLSELMDFATSVVRLPRKADDSPWLSEDIVNFDPAFLLFSPHVGELILEDRTAEVDRRIRLEHDGDSVTIIEGDDSKRWRVFKTTIEPSDAAKREAWELSARDVLPVIWAVPVEGRVSVGRFWAFFPLRDETTLTGIANAPWQINDDRTGLLEGSRLNQELLRALAKLVLDNIGAIVKPEDPGWVLDIVPARGREARCWGDDYLTQTFYDLARDRAVIPDQTGELRGAFALKLSPPDASREAVEAWGQVDHRPIDWCHPSALSTVTRRSRVDRLFEVVDQKAAPGSEWLESLIVDSKSAAHSAAAIHVAAIYQAPGTDGEALRRIQIQRSAIVLDNKNQLCQAKTGEIFVPLDTSPDVRFVRLVSQDLIAMDGVAADLKGLSIEDLTPTTAIREFLRQSFPRTSPQWDTFWTLARAVAQTETDAAAVVRKVVANRTLQVRTFGGTYRPLSQALLPGPVVPLDRSRDAGVAIDTDFHQEELDVLRQLGAEVGPVEAWDADRDPLVEEYRNACVDTYLNDLTGAGSRPMPEKMLFDQRRLVGPLEPLRYLSEDGSAAFVAELIKAGEIFEPWTLRHETQRHYPARQFGAPAAWAVKKYGVVSTSKGNVPVTKAWGPPFRGLGESIPVVDMSEASAKRLGIPCSPEELTSEHWTQVFDVLAESTNDGQIAAVYELAAELNVPSPTALRCRVGSEHTTISAHEVVVTANADAFAALREQAKPVLRASSNASADRLVKHWGLLTAGAHLRQETSWIEAAPPVPLVDALPTLRRELEVAGLTDMELVPCADLANTITSDEGTKRIAKDFEIYGNKILWNVELGLDGALQRLRDQKKLDISNEEITELAEGRWEQERRERLASIRNKKTNAERLLAALGEDVLKTRFPEGLLDIVEEIDGKLSPKQIAELALVVHGDDTLHVFRDELREAGFEPPQQWAGSRDARVFVKDLGFDEAFAGAAGTKLEPELLVLGPTDLPPLHDYQEAIVAGIDNLLNSSAKDRRALVSLPTGAGKTRVAVQALVQALADDRLPSPVLWIAQSDELCEQAVQTWSDVWRGIGKRGELRIGRLWGPNEVHAAPDSAQVVVAGIDKLNYRVDRPDYEWLSQASCVVIDEAHTAIAPSYTKVLTWLGIRQTARSSTTRAPLLGLSATPFRGTSKEQTERLVSRFGATRLDRVLDVGDDPQELYRRLQEMRILSEVDGETLQTQTTIDLEHDLSAEEKSSFAQMSNLPPRFLEAIALDVDRNRILVDSILSKPKDWPILVFAASTGHAHTLSALLAMRGVASAAIDYNTAPTLRRRYIDRFRKRELRVLTNYNVLTQGFDAPAVRAIYVARPTFSPNRYQQMIGRGLRGTENGGKDRCLIVNVQDNWTMYGDRLAFNEFEYLWTSNS